MEKAKENQITGKNRLRKKIKEEANFEGKNGSHKVEASCSSSIWSVLRNFRV